MIVVTKRRGQSKDFLLNDQSIKNQQRVFSGKRHVEKRLMAALIGVRCGADFVTRGVTQGIPTLERAER
ncbi:hypothetical protein [Pseudomonas congelans]|uniref:hypothetical protein n=1 Tax=Pseudomonas congelans TaxID=200452 RepID=UPI0018653858|nr:hypothetical protein [Pseudomonas congelans]